MGRLIRDRALLPDLILSSDAVRARLTAEAVAAAAGFDGTIQLEPSLYLASAAEIVEILSSIDEDAGRVMIVGHNPGLEELVARLTRAHESLPTASLALITLRIDRWADLTTKTRGTLAGRWRPKEL